MKRLILMRHAKSDWSQGGLSDFERPLNKRGVNDSSNMGKWMADHLELPDVILCSSARRTQQSMQLLLLGMMSSGSDPKGIEQYNFESMYLASTSTLKQLIHLHINQHESIMLIGHNPGMEGLLLHYCPNAPLTRSGKLMTTANIAVIEFDDLLNPALVIFQRPCDL
jgi:phosphohistidine phosphatase